MNWLTDNADAIRAGVFLSLLGLFLIWQMRQPFRTHAQQYHGSLLAHRMIGNISLSIIAGLLLKAAPLLTAVYAATWAMQAEIGVFNLIDIQSGLAIALSIVLLDLSIYWQHRLSHRVPILWRLHKVHHSDPDFDVSTALRFHPIELILSMLYKMLIIVALGAPQVAVILFEILLNACAMFNHTNIALSRRVERPLHWLIVTPDMHRVHHSVKPYERDSNFGFCLSLWDQMFNTLKQKARDKQRVMDVGLAVNPDSKLYSIKNTLTMPFKPD